MTLTIYIKIIAIGDGVAKVHNYRDFILQNGILYRKYNDDLLLVVPRSMQYDVIKQAHEKEQFSTGKMEQMLKKKFWFPHM